MTRTEFILWTFALFLLLVLKGPACGMNRNGKAPTGEVRDA